MIVLRSIEIAIAFIGLGTAALSELVVRRERPGARAAARLRRSCERLGPTFVKLGQALAQRRDLLPPDWIAELSRLQENAPPFPSEVAVRIVEAALGASVQERFEVFERTPLAAASVAQVHRARLKDGRDVVVKILRPGLRAEIDQDMRILAALAALGSAVIPALRRRRILDLVHEMWRSLRKEADLREEAKNVRRFARAFQGSSAVFIPDVVDELSASDVMVQEFGTGRHLGDASLQADGPRLAKAFVDFYLEQLFVVGVFHADPHPGNIFVREDGRFCFHDFGSVGWLDTRSREALLSFVQAFVHQDADWLTQAAFDLGLLQTLAERTALSRGVESILAELAGAPLGDWSLAAIMLNIARLGGPDSLALPPHLAALVRTVFTAEGTLRLIDPGLDMLETLSASGKELAATTTLAQGETRNGLTHLKWETALSAAAAPAAAARLLAAWRQGHRVVAPIEFPDVRIASERLARASERVADAVMALGLYVAASLLMQHSIGPRLFGELPLLAALGYAMALWFTLRLARGTGRNNAS